MKTIHILWHKKNYAHEWTLVRAFEAESDAQDIAELMRTFCSGELKVEASALAPCTGSSLPAPAIPRFREIDTTPRAALP